MRRILIILLFLVSNFLQAQKIEGEIKVATCLIHKTGADFTFKVNLEEGKYENLSKLVDKKCGIKIQLDDKKTGLDAIAIVKSADNNTLEIYLENAKRKYSKYDFIWAKININFDDIEYKRKK